MPPRDLHRHRGRHFETSLPGAICHPGRLNRGTPHGKSLKCPPRSRLAELRGDECIPSHLHSLGKPRSGSEQGLPPFPPAPGNQPAHPVPSRTVGAAGNQERDHLSPYPWWIASRLSAACSRETLTPPCSLGVKGEIRSRHRRCSIQPHTTKVLLPIAPL